MGEIIAIAMQKGGTGKTATVVNVATVLAMKGKKIAVVDFDSQGDASASFGIDPDEVERTIFDIFLKRCKLKDVVVKTKFGVDVYPANDDLAGLDLLVMENPGDYPDHRMVLRNVLEEIRNKYDFIFLDLPPSLSFLTVNALTAANEVIIPMQLEYLATRGIQKLLTHIERIKSSTNPTLKVKGVVGVMYISGTNLSSVILQQSRKFLTENSIKMFDTVINRSVKFGEAPMFGKPAIIYNPKNQAVQDYLTLTEEMFNV